MKNDSSNSPSIFEKIFTHDELNFLVEELAQLKQRNAGDKKMIEENLKQLNYQVYPTISYLWKSQDEAQKNPLVFFESLETQLKNYQLINLIIAYQPTQEQAEEICNYLRAKFDKDNIIIKIEINEEIVGACQLEYQGKNYDLSLLREIKQYAQK